MSRIWGGSPLMREGREFLAGFEDYLRPLFELQR